MMCEQLIFQMIIYCAFCRAGGVDNGGDNHADLWHYVFRLLLHRHDCGDQGAAHHLPTLSQVRVTQHRVADRAVPESEGLGAHRCHPVQLCVKKG